LRLFHENHFPGKALPPTSLGTFISTAADYEFEVEDDGLGYYSDGVKRTLTEEQIAMFRQSEIRELIKELELRPSSEHESCEPECREPSPTNFDIELAAAINAGSATTPKVSPELVHYLRRAQSEIETTTIW
jgi:hypothetical protein